MAHYALLDENNIVTQVIVGFNEYEIVDGVSDWELFYSKTYNQKCIRTSYNHRIRKQYAGIGYSYDPEADVFIAPQPYASWSLDANYDWIAPVPCPTEGHWNWNEEVGDWVEVPAGL